MQGSKGPTSVRSQPRGPHPQRAPTCSLRPRHPHGPSSCFSLPPDLKLLPPPGAPPHQPINALVLTEIETSRPTLTPSHLRTTRLNGIRVHLPVFSPVPLTEGCVPVTGAQPPPTTPPVPPPPTPALCDAVVPILDPSFSPCPSQPTGLKELPPHTDSAFSSLALL